jgi:hypothetical protein
MLSLANVAQLFTNKFSRLGASGLPFFFLAFRSFDRFWFRHFMPPDKFCDKVRQAVFSNFSMRTGNSRTRMPVAWYTALVIADAQPVRPISPIPLAPYSLKFGVGKIEKNTIQVRDVGIHRHQIVGVVVVHRFAVALVLDGFFQHGHADAHHY